MYKSRTQYLQITRSKVPCFLKWRERKLLSRRSPHQVGTGGPPDHVHTCVRLYVSMYSNYIYVYTYIYTYTLYV